jgi:3-oxoacyl-[acyl-carrier protein] reductase
MLRQAGGPDATEDDQQRIRAGMAERTPLGRIGAPAEVAALVVWLLSEEASYLTGALYGVDGGVSA